MARRPSRPGIRFKRLPWREKFGQSITYELTQFVSCSQSSRNLCFRCTWSKVVSASAARYNAKMS